ncbi:hypothetical protein K461DRAFT_315955 [Myriangium duriaei CBS 260.36]|uniref:Uncharacterized protein n=1 Tax=Myriangium duriaei CBS 260.36 TaxID=1168546 RepID=A0A9P4IYF1_9PEZI|nr:hypothetical protein K461DRAFT_315955 [Myriangium duriaei CBS 260.36]
MAEAYDESGYYDLVEHSRHPRTKSLHRAARLLSSMLDADCIPHAFIGGYSMLLAGSDRKTCNVDIAVQGGMEGAVQCIGQLPSACVPRRYTSWCARMFMYTKVKHHRYRKLVQVTAYACGIPRSLTGLILPTTLIVAGVPLPVLNLASRFALKLFAFDKHRHEKHYMDLEYMLIAETDNIQALRHGFEERLRLLLLTAYLMKAYKPVKCQTFSCVMPIPHLDQPMSTFKA